MLKVFRRLVAHSGETAGPLNIIRHLEKMDFTDWSEKKKNLTNVLDRGKEAMEGEGKREEERRGDGGKGRNQSKIRSDLSD